jgi:hypothetical protein
MIMGKVLKALAEIKAINDQTLPLIKAETTISVRIPEKSSFPSALKQRIDANTRTKLLNGAVIFTGLVDSSTLEVVTLEDGRQAIRVSANSSWNSTSSPSFDQPKATT